MTRPRRSSPLVKISKYTLLDEVRQNSFLAMFITGVVLIFLSRGCYQGNYVMNGQMLDAATVAGVVSKAAFHVIASIAMFVTALLSMRVFRRDRDQGVQSSLLSRPITRRQYIMGKAAGLWLLSALFMFILQAMVFLVAAITTKVLMPGYIVASLLCCINLLFVVVAVLLLSLLMPEIFALLSLIGIAIVSLLVDGINAIGSNPIIQTITAANGVKAASEISLAKILYYIWPKLSGTQYLASSLINGEGLGGFWSVYPLLNILFYCLVLGVLLLRQFRKEEIF